MEEPLFCYKAPVAQLDRVSASEAEGHAFESHRVRHIEISGDKLLP